MKNLLAPLVAMLLLPACGGDREQSPGPNAAPSPTQTEPSTETTTSMTETTSSTSTTTETTTQTAPKMSMTDMERDAVRSLVSAFNAHDAQKIAALYAPGARTAGAGPSGWMEETGRPSIEEAYTRLFTAFPDVRFASPRTFLSGNVAIQEWVLTGTHKGQYDTVKPSNKPIGLHGASVYWFNDQGQITQDNNYYDAPAISTQIGTAKGKMRALPTFPEGETQFIVAMGSADDSRWVAAAKTLYTTYGTNDEKGYLGGFARDATRTNFAQAEDRKGQNAARDDFRAFMKAFPDVSVATRNVWGFGEYVVVESVATGTQTGAYGQYKATQKPVTLHTLDVLRFNEDGKVTEMVSYGSSQELTAPAATGTTSSRTQQPDPSQQQPGYNMNPGNKLYPGQNPYPGPTPYPSGSQSPNQPPGSPPGSQNPGPTPQPTSTGIQRRP